MPISERIRRERADRYTRRIEAAEARVPEGPYCYERITEIPSQDGKATAIQLPTTKACPYYKLRKDKPAQRNGYCRHLKAGDFSPHPHQTTMLWDALKECGLNLGDEADGT